MLGYMVDSVHVVGGQRGKVGKLLHILYTYIHIHILKNANVDHSLQHAVRGVCVHNYEVSSCVEVCVVDGSSHMFDLPPCCPTCRGRGGLPF